MRSLFTEDIPGAVPRNRYYDKELYLQKHLKEIERFGPKNPEYRRVFEWYDPVKRVVEPIDKDQGIIKPHNRRDQLSEGKLSQSLMLSKIKQESVTGKVTDGISLSESHRSSIFGEAGRKSLGDSFANDLAANPYFPHKYSNKHEFQGSKLTGKREWRAEEAREVAVPAAGEQYYPKWG
jgi:hypothetical protein